MGLIATCVVAPPAAGQGPAGHPPATNFLERFLEASEIPVSGSLRVGIMAGVGATKVRPDRFHVLLPAGRRDPLCVEISSRDGRYEARRLRYELRGSAAGLTRLELPSQHLSELARYSADELAILAWLSPGCDAARAEYVIASWEPVAAPGTVTVFLNSNVPTFVLARGNDGARLGEVACPALSGRLRAFNRRCELPLAWLRNGELTLRKRERRGNGNVYVSTPLPILVPGQR